MSDCINWSKGLAHNGYGKLTPEQVTYIRTHYVKDSNGLGKLTPEQVAYIRTHYVKNSDE